MSFSRKSFCWGESNWRLIFPPKEVEIESTVLPQGPYKTEAVVRVCSQGSESSKMPHT